MAEPRVAEILIVEDSPTDLLLAKEALRTAKVANHVHAVIDGIEAVAFLKKQGKYANSPRPDLVLLDLNLPRKSGREVLAEIKSDPSVASIPVVVLTTSMMDEDVTAVYGLHANCMILKPLDFESFQRVVQAIGDFWFAVVRLPSRTPGASDM